MDPLEFCAPMAGARIPSSVVAAAEEEGKAKRLEALLSCGDMRWMCDDELLRGMPARLTRLMRLRLLLLLLLDRRSSLESA